MRRRILAGSGLILLLSAGCTDSAAMPESDGDATFGAVQSASQRGDSPAVVAGGEEAGTTTASDSSAARGGGAIGSGN